ncbi:MAG: phosphoribosylanthranilate isomerase [Acidobacteriia bacterium]|nr:phosphoribosylanthranilate isomerase [Terriglobia bacterium]
MATRVKICGITRSDDALLAAELGAAALGFNFYPPSPRYIAPPAAGEIIRQLPPFVMPVGVFADQADAENIAAAAREAGVAALQLHGPALPKMDGPLGSFRVIIAVPVGEGFRPEDLRRFKVSAFLLDAHDPTLLGGTGKTFDWSVARDAKRFGAIILAGGLTPQNVAQAIREVRPDAVDVASGVESSPGVKDAGKLRAFFAAVEEADQKD